MSGQVIIVGLGPGDPEHTTPAASDALAGADHIVGYATYLDRVPQRVGQVRHASDNREELARARHALSLAQDGASVAIVSSGDAGVYAMASTVFEALDADREATRDVDVSVIPGVTAMVAAAARLGAPLGHDFCAISLSDNLKPWSTIVKRLEAATAADFVLALYNPVSRARPWQLGEAFAILRKTRSPATPVAFATAISRADENIEITTLGEADPTRADMRTLVIVGSSTTRCLERTGKAPWVYTPRRAEAVAP
ncbi:MAG: precorrin-3B C(17)-methyltransferase [Pseudomonadota bacterium]